jgi:hypothetical protein
MKNVALLSLAILSLMAAVAEAAPYGGGTGTAGDPYLIYDANQMNAIGANSLDWDKHFKLMADIDLNAYTGTDFNIIGTEANPFTGVFDGNDHAIANFTFGSQGRGYVGIFARVGGQSSAVKNLTLINPNVQAVAGNYVGALIGWFRGGTIVNCRVDGGRISGASWLGGLIGYVDGAVSDCQVTTSVSGSGYGVGGLAGWSERDGLITNCYSTGQVTGGDRQVGGLVGSNYGMIFSCSSEANVSGNYSVGGLVGTNDGTVAQGCATGYVSSSADYTGALAGINTGTLTACCARGSVTGHLEAGGLVGRNYERIANCYAAGDVVAIYHVGGIAGTNWGRITNCYATGSALGDDDRGGGLVGSSCTEDAVVTNSFWDKQTSGLSEMCGNLYYGASQCDNAYGKTTAQMYEESTFAAGGWDFNTPVWEICEGLDYPRLWWENEGPILIISPTELYFDALLDGPNPQAQMLSIGNCGTGNIDWQIAEACEWLTVGPNSGSFGEYETYDVNANVDATSLAAGDYHCELLISDVCDPNLADIVPVTLHIQGPLIDLSTNEVEFVALEGGPNPNDITLTVTNGGGGILNWQIAEDCNWLAVEPNSGSLAAYENNELTITVDKTSMPKGDYYCDLTVSDPCAENSPQIVAVHLDVVGPELYVWPGNLEFPALLAEPNVFEQILEMKNDAGGTLNWQIDVPNDCNWLSVYPLSGTSRGEVNEVTITVDSNGLALGFYECELTVSDANATNSPQAIPVILHVYIPGELHVPTEYSTIQAAIDAANEHDTIIVQPSVYNENIDFGAKNLIATSIDPLDNAVVAATIIDGSGLGPVVTLAGAQGPSCILTGFTIVNGTNGVHCNSADPTISDCVLADNANAGLRCVDGDPTVTNCRIMGNAGDGINLSSSRVNNRATVSNCRITGNQGRGMHCNKSRDWIANCVIAGNRAEGIWSYRSRGLTIRNCTVFANAEAGIYSDSAKMTILNSIVWDNASQGASQIYSSPGDVTATYSDVQDGFSGLGNINVDPCFAELGYWGHTDDPNTQVEPNDPNAVYVDGDYHLKTLAWRWDPNASQWTFDSVTSRCIDAGNPGSILAAEPLAAPLDPNNVRGHNLRINMGAYGGTAEASIPPYDWALLADLTNDGTVDFADLGHELANWLTSGVDLPGDLDRNEIVDMADLALLGQDFSARTSWHQP